MKHRYKKAMAISIGLVLVAGLFIWYFLPVLASKLFIHSNSKLLHQLNVQPSNIDKLPTSPPEEWANISIDTLSLCLPMYRYNKIRVTSLSTGIGFISDQGTVFLPSLVPTVEFQEYLKENDITYPLVSYEDFLKEFTTIPDDISFFNSRSENINIYNNLILKLMAIPISGIDGVLAVNSSDLKAVCIMHETRKNGFGATLVLYNQTENITFDIAFMGYKNSDILHSDILYVLGSIRMPGRPLEAERIKADIESISRNYNLPEQTL